MLGYSRAHYTYVYNCFSEEDMFKTINEAIAIIITTSDCLTKQYDGITHSYVCTNTGGYSTEEIISTWKL